MRVSVGFGGFQPLVQTVPVVRAADAVGLDGVWSAEHLGFQDAVVPSAVYAANSERIRLGLLGLAPVSRHPGLLAMELGTLAGVAPGRVRVQVGYGDPTLVARLGDDGRRVLSRVEQFVSVLRGLLAGEKVNGEVAGHRFADYTIAGFEGHGIPPVDPPIPIDLMAVRPRMTALAARVADGVSLSTNASRGYLTGVAETVGEALGAAGRKRSDFQVVAHALAAIMPTEEQALAQLMPVLALSGGDFAVLAPDLFDPAELAEAAGDPDREARLITPEVAAGVAFVATPDTVAETLAGYAATGIDELCLHFETPPDHTVAMLEVVAEGRRAVNGEEAR